MKTIRRSSERGYLDHGWLQTYHSFSFGSYHDPKHMGFRDLRVINEDKIQAGKGFGTHSHQDMEIISYVLSGSLAHKDSMGNGSSIPPGEFQYMSAGTGVTHSEFNHSEVQVTHLLQIWILPNKSAYEPRYAQVGIAQKEKTDQLKLVVANDGSGAPIEIHQDVSLYNSILSPKKSIEYPLSQDRHAWLQVIRGNLSVNNEDLSDGDAIAFSEETLLQIQNKDSESEILLFDLN